VKDILGLVLFKIERIPEYATKKRDEKKLKSHKSGILEIQAEKEHVLQEKA